MVISWTCIYRTWHRSLLKFHELSNVLKDTLWSVDLFVESSWFSVSFRFPLFRRHWLSIPGRHGGFFLLARSWRNHAAGHVHTIAKPQIHEPISLDAHIFNHIHHWHTGTSEYFLIPNMARFFLQIRVPASLLKLQDHAHGIASMDLYARVLWLVWIDTRDANLSVSLCIALYPCRYIHIYIYTL